MGIKTKPREKRTYLQKIGLWWEMEGRYIIKDFKTGIRNLYYWLPVIWKDRNHDYHYIFEMLKKKLEFQANFMEVRNTFVNTPGYVSRMRTCQKLIQKIQDDFYGVEYLDYVDSDFTFNPVEDGKFFTVDVEIHSETLDDFLLKYPLVHKKVLKGEGPFPLDGKNEVEIKQNIARNICWINEKRAKKLLFKILEENIERWWD